MFRAHTKKTWLGTLPVKWLDYGTVLLASILICASWNPAQQSKPSKPQGKEHAPTPAESVTTVPFRAGENLQYRVLFSKFAVNAATVETSVVEQRSFFGRPAWHFRASAHTTNTMRMVFPLDDQFDSYASTTGLSSLQYEMYLREQGQEQKSIYRLTTDSEPAPEQATAVRVAPGTRDAIDYLYSLRSVDWHAKREFRAPVFDGRHIYDAVASMDTPQGVAHVPAGDLPAFRVVIRLYEHGQEVPDTHVWVWFGLDAARTPVLVEADIPFGSARIELLPR